MKFLNTKISTSIQLLLFVVLTNTLFAQVNDVQMYTFAHSLIDHRPPAIPTPSDETTILHWINDIAQDAGKSFATTGQFGQLNNHVDDLPPNSNLGYDQVSGSWDETINSFGDSGINTILITAANFIQYEPPTNPDPSDPLGRTVIELTETIFDWVENEKPNLKYYIYSNWPEMDLQNAFPPTPPQLTEINEFHDITIGDVGPFNEWWIDYQNQMLITRPDLNTRLIPVGEIVSKILRDVIPSQIMFEELYEDSAPHGRANVYFLAGMITYMAIFEENIPTTYMPDDIISPEIRNELTVISNFIWDQLLNYNLPDGSSRVFYSDIVSSNNNPIPFKNLRIKPTITNTSFKLEGLQQGLHTIKVIGLDGQVLTTFYRTNSSNNINIENLTAGMYFVQIINHEFNVVHTKKFIKH